MSKLISTLLLATAFSFPAFASEQQDDPEHSSRHYICWAKDYENLWFAGRISKHLDKARWSAHRACRIGSLAPETCRVKVCKKWSHSHN